MNATASAATYPEPRLLIAGERVSGGGRRTKPVINPANGKVLAELPLATPEDLNQALDAAQRAFPVWRDTAPQERGKIMKRAADLMRQRVEQIAYLATIEEGKPIAESRIETLRAAEIFEWYGEEVRRTYGRALPQRAPGVRMTVVKQPVGPVAAFGPWNFPVGNPARKLGAPIAAGCPVILKPAEETPATALAVAQCFLDAGVPEGVLSVVFGVPDEVSTHLLGSPIIRKMSFTGSTKVGKHLSELAARNMIRTTMELGGHAPVLVFDDIDLEHVLDLSVAAKFRNAGQVCVSPTRFYVHEKLYAAFVEGFTARAKALEVGDPQLKETQMGPLAHAGRAPFLEPLLDDARKCGAKFHTAGTALEGPGYFFAPTVISDISNEARMMNEEPFGPIALMNPFTSFDQVIEQANRLPYGLAAYAFSNDAKTVTRLGQEIEAGMVGINSYMISVPESPFGGVKESGHGSDEGIEGLDGCMVTKFISES